MSNGQQYDDEQIAAHARTAEEAIAQLCRETISTPAMTPAGVSNTLAHLAALAAALPQASAQLGWVLGRCAAEQDLTMDEMVEPAPVAEYIDVARLHLEEIRELGVQLHRRLNDAQNSTAHIISHGTRT